MRTLNLYSRVLVCLRATLSLITFLILYDFITRIFETTKRQLNINYAKFLGIITADVEAGYAVAIASSEN